MVFSCKASFNKFNDYVDAALKKFEQMLSDNGKIKEWYDKQKEEKNK